MPDDITGHWLPSNRPTVGKILRRMLLGCKRPNGTTYWSRREYLSWCWRAFWLKWWRGPRRCKRGVHRIGYQSDTGMGCCEKDGCMDVWCLDCDIALRVPVDDAMRCRGTGVVLDIMRGLKL